MSILGRTFSLFALMNKMILSFSINFGCAKTVVGLKLLTLCQVYFFMSLFKIHSPFWKKSFHKHHQNVKQFTSKSGLQFVGQLPANKELKAKS